MPLWSSSSSADPNLLLRFALRLADAPDPDQVHPQDPWVRTIGLLLSGQAKAALACLPPGPDSSAITSYWRTRVLSTCRRLADAERSLCTSLEFWKTDTSAAGPLSGKETHEQLGQLLEQERIRQLGFRYQIREAWLDLETLKKCLEPEILAQTWSLAGDLWVNDVRGDLDSLVDGGLPPFTRELRGEVPGVTVIVSEPPRAFHIARTAYEEARKFGVSLAPSFQEEQRIKLCDLFQRHSQWKELRAQMLPRNELGKLSPARRSFYLRCHLQLELEDGGIRRSPIDERDLADALQHRPHHVGGLLHVAQVAELATRSNLLSLEQERILLDELMLDLHALDQPADLLDWLDRGLYEHARPMYNRHTELWLSDWLGPKEVKATQRMHHALEANEHPCNRHVLDLVRQPHLHEKLEAALLREDPTSALDEMEPGVQLTPPHFPTLEELQAGDVHFVRLMKGWLGWHVVRVLPEGGGLETLLLSADWVVDHERRHAEALGAALFMGYPEGTIVHVVAEGEAEDISYLSLPRSDSIWGAHLTIVQAPNLSFLFRRSPSIHPCQSGRWPDEPSILEEGFSPIPEMDAFFRDPAQPGILHMAGHGQHDEMNPHEGRIVLLSTGREVDVGDVFQAAEGCRLLVLDTCEGAALHDPSTENDLGLANAALFGGAELVLAFRDRISPHGERRKALLSSLYRELILGRPPAEALRLALSALARVSRDPVLCADGISLLGALPPNKPDR
jgi:hypothetical protein